MKNDKLNLWRAVYAERCKYGFRREYGTVEVDDRLCLPHEWGLVPYVQALLLARTIRGDIDEYPPFLWK